MDLESHDRLIAWVLGLSHALNIAFLRALADSGEAAPKLAELSSTTFDEQLGVAGRVVHDSPQLYFEIQSLNEYATESLSALLDRRRAPARRRTIGRRGAVRALDGTWAPVRRGAPHLTAASSHDPMGILRFEAGEFSVGRMWP